MPVRARITRIALVGMAGELAGLAFGPAFGGFPGPGRFVLAVSAVTVAATMAGLVAVLVPRVSPAVAGMLGAAGVTVIALASTGTGVAAVHGPWQLLTAALPSDATGPPLAAIATLAGWATLAGALAAAYAANPIAPLLAPLLCLVAALGVAASAPPLPGWYAPAAVALAAAGALTGQRAAGSLRPDRKTWLRRLPRVAPAAAVVAVAALAAAVLGPVAPGVGARPPADARSLVPAPVQPRSGVSPLQQYLALRDGTRPLKLIGTVSRPGTPLRMATLTHFDGTYWTVGGDYRRAGTRLPPAPGAAQIPVDQQVQVAAGDLDWLVTAGRPTAVSVAHLAVDEATGDVAVPLGAAPPQEYSASSTVADLGVDDILAARPATIEQQPQPPMPPALRTFVETAVAEEPPGVEQLLALYRVLHTSGEFRYDEAEEVAGGHGYYQLLRLLQSKRGTSEQYASAYAVMAGHLGYDARVVMGFLPTYSGQDFVAVGRDVAAWVEVRFDRVGWVTIDPSPRGNPIGTRANAPATGGGANVAGPLDAVPGASVALPADPTVATASGTGSAAPAGSALPVQILSAAIIVGVALSAIPATKSARRRRRRRAPSTRLAVWGAWWETVDVLRTAGVPAGPARTTGEVAQLAAAAPWVGEFAPLTSLVSLVDEAGFAPEHPSATTRHAAWAAADQIRRHVRSRMSWPRRAADHIDPRPLRVRPKGSN